MRDETVSSKSEVFKVSYSAKNENLEKTEYSHYGSFDLEITIKNSTKRRSAEIEAYYVTTRDSWTLSESGAECAYDEIEDSSGKRLRRHLLTPSIRRLAPNAFAQIKPRFRKRFWSKFTGEESLEEYTSSGSVKLEIATSEGSVDNDLSVSVTFDEIPF